jgi:hypothetical protein
VSQKKNLFFFFHRKNGVFTIIFHHGGEFIKDNNVVYKGGVENIVSGLEINEWGMGYGSNYELVNRLGLCKIKC